VLIALKNDKFGSFPIPSNVTESLVATGKQINSIELNPKADYFRAFHLYSTTYIQHPQQQTKWAAAPPLTQYPVLNKKGKNSLAPKLA